MTARVLVLCLAAPLTLTAGEPGYVVESTTARRDPLMDGAEEAWKPARAISWGPEGYDTTFRALWNGAGMFVRFDATDANPWGTLSRRDEPIYQEEVVEIFLDLDRSGSHYAEVDFSPANVVCDYHIERPLPEKDGDPPWKGDRGWNFDGLQSRVEVRHDGDHTRGWRVIAFLPWDGLRSLPSAAGTALPPREGDWWRFNVFRIERPHGPTDPERDLVLAAWSPAPIPKFHVASVFRKLEFR